MRQKRRNWTPIFKQSCRQIMSNKKNRGSFLQYFIKICSKMQKNAVTEYAHVFYAFYKVAFSVTNIFQI